MRHDYSADAATRELQLEARAHVAVQQWIDDDGLGARASTVEGLREIHHRFCEALPDALLWAEDPASGVRARVVPGGLRDTDVIVGRHVAVSPGVSRD